MSADRITIIVHLPSSAQHIAMLEAGVRQVLHDMSAEPQFVDCVLYRSQSEAHTLVVYETWQCSRAQFLAEQLDKPYRHAFERDLPGLLATPRRIEFLDQADPPLTLTASHAV